MEQLAEDAPAIAAATANAGETIVDVIIQLIYQRVFSMLLDPEHGEGSSSAGAPACAPHVEEEDGKRTGIRPHPIPQPPRREWARI
jgi:hypothetical protein